MEKGTNVPGGANASDRLTVARDQHALAVGAYEAAQRDYVEQVNALPLPRLMAGDKVRVTDMDSVTAIMTAAAESAGTHEQAQALFSEVMAYRAARKTISHRLGIGLLAEAVVDGAAEMIRIAGEA